MEPGLFIGLAGLDIVYTQDALPAENQKSKTNRYETYVGGPAANAAITYALLGGEATLITCIGDSDLGKTIRRDISENYGVTLLDCIAGQSVLPCVSSVSINALSGSRTIWSGQQIFQPVIGTQAREKLAHAGFCLFDCSLPEISIELIKLSKDLTKTIVLDMGSWKPDSASFMSLATEVIASSACIPPPPYPPVMEAAAHYGVLRSALTNGEDAILWRDGDHQGEIQPPATRAADTLGAGDVFHGAYCFFRFHEGYPFDIALSKAAGVAAKSVEYPGPRKGVEMFIKNLSTP